MKSPLRAWVTNSMMVADDKSHRPPPRFLAYLFQFLPTSFVLFVRETPFSFCTNLVTLHPSFPQLCTAPKQPFFLPHHNLTPVFPIECLVHCPPQMGSHRWSARNIPQVVLTRRNEVDWDRTRLSHNAVHLHPSIASSRTNSASIARYGRHECQCGTGDVLEADSFVYETLFSVFLLGKQGK